MNGTGESQPNAPGCPITIVSGGVGRSAEQVVRTALAQFDPCPVALTIVPHVRRSEQLEAVVQAAAGAHGVIVHTLVDTALRRSLVELANRHQVLAIDLMGPLLDCLSLRLGCPPLEQPGRYRQLHATSVTRAEAIEWTLAHDDGQLPAEWHAADIVLVGVSRVAKTPTSLYLAALGWKVANASVVPNLAPPQEVFTIDRRRVIGLMIDPTQLVEYRRQRQRRLPLPLGRNYTDPAALDAELDWARQIFRRGGFQVLDVTGQPIEAIADDIVRRVPAT